MNARKGRIRKSRHVARDQSAEPFRSKFNSGMECSCTVSHSVAFSYSYYFPIVSVVLARVIGRQRGWLEGVRAKEVRLNAETIVFPAVFCTSPIIMILRAKAFATTGARCEELRST